MRRWHEHKPGIWCGYLCLRGGIFPGLSYRYGCPHMMSATYPSCLSIRSHVAKERERERERERQRQRQRERAVLRSIHSEASKTTLKPSVLNLEPPQSRTLDREDFRLKPLQLESFNLNPLNHIYTYARVKGKLNPKSLNPKPTLNPETLKL